MPVVTVSTLGGEVVIPFPDGSQLTAGDLVRELAARTPNHRSTFRVWVNDSESPITGDAPDMTGVVDTAKDITLLYEPYKSFDTADELRAAASAWCAGSVAKEAVSKVYGRVIGGWDVSLVTDMSKLFTRATAFDDDLGGWDTSSVTTMNGICLATQRPSTVTSAAGTRPM
jgi:hypothetical protein